MFMGVFDPHIILINIHNKTYDIMQPDIYHCSSLTEIREVCQYIPVRLCPNAPGHIRTLVIYKLAGRNFTFLAFTSNGTLYLRCADMSHLPLMNIRIQASIWVLTKQEGSFLHLLECKS